MELGLAGRTAFIAGSSRGIGLAIARAFLQEGANVVITGRQQAQLDQAAAELAAIAGGERVLAFSGDMTDEGSVRRAVAATIGRFDSLHAAVANLGSGKGTRGWQVPVDEWKAALDMNLLGGVVLAVEVIPHLIANGGTLTFVSSIAGVEALDAPVAYGAAKSAVLASSGALARALGPQGVRVNAVVPGNVLHPGSTWATKVAEDPDEVHRYLAAQVPMARFGTPDEVADAVVFLASERAAFVTGACLIVDGGQTRSFR